MPRIHNDQLTREIRETAKIQPADENIPSILANQVVPVIEVNPRIVRNLNIVAASRTSSGGLTILNGRSTDIYVHSILFSMVKDAACDVASGSVSISSTILGAVREIANIAVLTLTAQEQCVFIQFNHPLKIDRNQGISFGGQTFTAGAMVRSAVITYWEDEQND